MTPRGGEEHSEACRPTKEIYLPLYLFREIYNRYRQRYIDTFVQIYVLSVLAVDTLER